MRKLPPLTDVEEYLLHFFPGQNLAAVGTPPIVHTCEPARLEFQRVIVLLCMRAYVCVYSCATIRKGMTKKREAQKCGKLQAAWTIFFLAPEVGS